MNRTAKDRVWAVLAVAGALALGIPAVSCTKGGNSNSNIPPANVSNVNATSAPKEGFHAELKTESVEVQSGQPTGLIIYLKDASGALLRDLDLSHEKPVHLIVVSSDLFEFDHIHPESQPDGSYRVTHTFPNGGDYKLYADFTPLNAPQVIEHFQLKVAGTQRPSVSLVPDDTSTKAVDGLRVTMQPDKAFRAGGDVMLNLAISDEKTGKPVTDLERYLGAPAHIVIISEDISDFLHVHPTEKGKMNGSPTEEMKGMGGMDHPGNEKANVGNGSISAEISAHTSFPRSGLYKVWAQFQRSGRVITVPFVVRVAAG